MIALHVSFHAPTIPPTFNQERQLFSLFLKLTRKYLPICNKDTGIKKMLNAKVIEKKRNMIVPKMIWKIAS